MRPDSHALDRRLDLDLVMQRLQIDGRCGLRFFLDRLSLRSRECLCRGVVGPTVALGVILNQNPHLGLGCRPKSLESCEHGVQGGSVLDFGQLRPAFVNRLGNRGAGLRRVTEISLCSREHFGHVVRTRGEVGDRPAFETRTVLGEVGVSRFPRDKPLAVAVVDVADDIGRLHDD